MKLISVVGSLPHYFNAAVCMKGIAVVVMEQGVCVLEGKWCNLMNLIMFSGIEV